jgi:exopolysaccharide biosynthesis polyprenyl glycosylphosphotransferase
VGALESVDPGPLAALWAAAIATLSAGRATVRAWARRRVWYWQNAVIIGRPLSAAPLVRRIGRNPRFGINVVAAVDPGQGRRFAPSELRYIGHVPVIGDSPSVLELVHTFGVDRVIIAGPIEPTYEGAIVGQLADRGIHVDFMPSWSETLGVRLDVHTLAGVPLLTAPGTELGRSALVTKRLVDVILGGLALVALSPLLAVCAIAIKLDSPGPVLFRQRRVGKHERRFEVFKFRSMYEDAEARKHEVAALNFHGGGTERGMFKIREDPRITRVGAILRRYSLDELPQLINVIRGDMSLVGPRPLIESEHCQIDGNFLRRASLKPGVTGIWQVHGRSEVPFEEMVALDCLYVRGWSLGGDIKIMLRTFAAVLRARGAY